MGLDLTGIGSVAEAAKGIADKIWPDKTEIEKAKLAAELQAAMGQMEINKVEAASTNWFIAGWRPFVGWVCGLGLTYAAIFEPIARFVATVGFKYTGAFPTLDTNITLQVLLGLLGLGAMRTYEKSTNSEGNRK